MESAACGLQPHPFTRNARLAPRSGVLIQCGVKFALPMPFALLFRAAVALRRRFIGLACCRGARAPVVVGNIRRRTGDPLCSPSWSCW